MIRNRNRSLTLAAGLLLVAVCLVWVGRGASGNRGGLSDEGGGSAKQASGEFKVSARKPLGLAAEKRRRESISKAAQKWYAEVLEKYPDLAPKFRDIPDEQNGYLQFLQMAESPDLPRVPNELIFMFGGDVVWNPEAWKSWLGENQEYADQILRIAELPDQSAKGIDYLRFHSSKTSSASQWGTILGANARLAFESGDTQSALLFATAAMNLSSHFADIEVPSLIHLVVATGIRHHAENVLVEHALPALAGRHEELASWRDALTRGEEPSSAYGRALIGEWNVMMRGMVLPALVGGPSPNGGRFRLENIDGFTNAYATLTREVASGLANAGPGRLDLAMNGLSFSEAGLGPKEIDELQGATSGHRNLFEALGVEVSRRALKSAAIAMVLGEEPPVDPVSGLPFVWNPETRTLAMPQADSAVEPVKVP